MTELCRRRQGAATAPRRNAGGWRETV